MKEKRRFFNFLFKMLVLSLSLSFIIISCKTEVDSGVENQTAVLKIRTSNPETENSLRQIEIDKIVKADIFVYGKDMDLIQKTDVDVVGGKGSIEIPGVLYGKNRVIKIQAKQNIENVLNNIDGICIYNVFDVASPEVTVDVNWGTTALGKVFYYLMEDNYDVSNVSVDFVKNLIKSDVHSVLIDSRKIADSIISGNSTAASDYVLTSGNLTFTSESVLSGLKCQITDPISKVIDFSTTNTISNIAPGTWNFKILNSDGTILYKESVTISSGKNIDLGNLILKVPSIRLEDASGNQITTNISAETTVYLSARTLNGETSLSGVKIYYTLDGTEPNSSSTLYNSATGIKVSSGITLKAIGIKSGLINSDIQTFEFESLSSKLGEKHPSTGKFSVVSVPTSGEPGALYNGSNVVFSVYSKNAEKILLEIYDEAYGKEALYDYWLTKGSDDFWRIELKDVPNYTLYAFRAWGPNWTFSENWTRGNSSEGYKSDCDSSGNRFNPNKVLFDPYAREISHDVSNPLSLSENGNKHTNAETTSGSVNRNIDSAKIAPKSVVIEDSTDCGTKPKIPQKDAIIYEAHARGITKHPSSSNLQTILNGIEGFESVQNVPENLRGTYAGAAYLAPYLKGLGINTIELLPVHESDNDGNLDNAPGGNYWAYMTFGYFAPDRRYSFDKSLGGPTREFKQMVKSFHEAGIEVYLDVVYNHTGEGGPWSSSSTEQCQIVSMRGFDNQTYYSLVKNDRSKYWETTGCGNNMQCDNQIVREFIIDSLDYWITEMGVDGFRFDLAPVLGREYDAISGNWKLNWNNEKVVSKTLTDILNLGIANDVEMIAESWDCASDGYSVGGFPTGWGGWNGKYRDALRSYVGAGTPGAANDFIYGNKDLFEKEGGPHKSINFICAHDGFTLADLCTYSGAGNANNQNLEWPFGPSDGGNGDYNSIAGNTSEMKRQSARNYFAIQMMSRGIPMIVWGDEFGRTQNGNNNPYNIDSVATWSNYYMINTDSPHTVSTGGGGTYHNNFGKFNNSSDLNGNFLFSKFLMNLRSKEPALNQDNYTNVPYEYYNSSGAKLSSAEQALAIKIEGSAITGGSDYYLMMNMSGSEVSFAFEAPKTDYIWTRIVDTGDWAETNYNFWEESNTECTYSAGGTYGVGPKRVTILKQVPAPNSTTGISGGF